MNALIAFLPLLVMLVIGAPSVASGTRSGKHWPSSRLVLSCFPCCSRSSRSRPRHSTERRMRADEQDQELLVPRLGARS